MARDPIPFPQQPQKSSEQSASLRRDPKREHMISARFDSDTYREFKMLAAENSMGTDDMLALGIALIFRKLGRPLPHGVAEKLKALGIEV